MKKFHFGIMAVGTALLLLGAGCANDTGNSTKQADDLLASKPEDTVTTDTLSQDNIAVTTPNTDESSSDLKLSAEAVGGNQVKLSWTAPTGLTEANRFIIVESTDPNPEHDGKHNWMRQYYANRAVLWSQRSSGLMHYRICLTENNENDKCVKYSNDASVEVK